MPRRKTTPDAPPRRAGRPTKLTPEVAQQIVGRLKLAVPRETAAAEAGIDSHTLRDWLKRGARAAARGEIAPEDEIFVKFAADVAIASANGETGLVVQLRKHAAGDARAAMWMLERMYPKRYAPRLQVLIDNETKALMDVLEKTLPEEQYIRVLEALATRDSEGGAAEDPSQGDG